MTSCAQPALYVPLTEAALCLDCETVFKINGQCPACASDHIMSLARWLDRKTSSKEAVVPELRRRQ